MTVEEIPTDVDVEGRSSLRVQRTESHQLAFVTHRPAGPILLLQVLQQGQALFGFFEVLAHGVVWAPGGEPKTKFVSFPGKDGGRIENVSQTQRPEDLQNRSQTR